MSFFTRWLSELREYNRIAKIDEIARRYFAMNGFDGTLTALGIVLAAFFAGINDSRIVLATGIGAAVAMGISGVWGAYFAESAERTKQMKELERATLSRLRETKIGRAARAATVIVAAVDGVAPFLAVLLVMSPVFFAPLLGIREAYLLSIAIAFLLLFLLGVFLGAVSRENVLKYGLIMIVAGLVIALLNFLLLGGGLSGELPRLA